MENEQTSAPSSVVHQVTQIVKSRVNLFDESDSEISLYTQIMKEAKSRQSQQGVVIGRQPHPFDLAKVANLQTVNEHHSTCLHTKVASLVGLGFVDGQQEETLDEELGTTRKKFVEGKVDKTLDPLCDPNFADVLSDIGQDYEQTGTGYMEVVRERPGAKIIGLSHLPSKDTNVFVEDDDYNYHYEIRSTQGVSRRFAQFGDSQEFIRRAQDSSNAAVSFNPEEMPKENGNVSEVIAFRKPTSLSRWYGFPDWISAVPAIELSQMLMQYKYDFFVNRGVPEFMLFLLGAKLEKKDWEKVENALKANIGIGNAHKSLALNLDNPEIEVILHKLALEGKSEDTFAANKEALALAVVTAHRVPPLLAGILIPGKLGATNELPNALMSFQILVIGPSQRLFQRTLGGTLGGDNGVAGLTIEDFAFQKITEEIDVGNMDTVARMRQSPMQASQEGRDLKQGVKD